MNTTIRLRVKKDIDTATEKKILMLKGSLITHYYTDIIHFDDEGEESYVHFFTTDTSRKKEVLDFVASRIHEAALHDTVMIIE